MHRPWVLKWMQHFLKREYFIGTFNQCSINFQFVHQKNGPCKNSVSFCIFPPKPSHLYCTFIFFFILSHYATNSISRESYFHHSLHFAIRFHIYHLPICCIQHIPAMSWSKTWFWFLASSSSAASLELPQTLHPSNRPPHPKWKSCSGVSPQQLVGPSASAGCWPRGTSSSSRALLL